MSRLLALYPAWWRRRYGPEISSVLESSPPGWRDQVDLARGAADAWLHPPEPSWLPPLAAVAGGGFWTVAAAGITAQPVPPDWPGYVLEVVPIALAGVVLVAVALLGFAVRAADPAPRATVIASFLAVVGYAGWIAALAGTLVGNTDAATLGATQAAAMVGTAAVGIAVGRTGSEGLATCVLLAAGAMLVPWGPIFLVFGACLTVLGVALIVERREGSWTVVGGG